MGSTLANIWETRLKGAVPAVVDEKPETISIKMPVGTKERLKQQAVVLGIPYRDLVRSVFEHGLDFSTSKAKKVAQTEARSAAKAEALVAELDGSPTVFVNTQP